MSNTQSKVWFITGAGRGFGRIWDIAALAPSVEEFGDAILPLELDVTHRVLAASLPASVPACPDEPREEPMGAPFLPAPRFKAGAQGQMAAMPDKRERLGK